MKMPFRSQESFTSTFFNFLKSFLLYVFQLIINILEGELRPFHSIQNHIDKTASQQTTENRRWAGEKIGKVG